MPAIDPQAASDIIKRLYSAFNARALEDVLERVTEDVVWANGMEGGHLQGRAAVREYWQRQFAVVSSTVEPTAIKVDDGRATADVHQVVRAASTGEILSDSRVTHAFTFHGTRVARFDIVAP